MSFLAKSVQILENLENFCLELEENGLKNEDLECFSEMFSQNGLNIEKLNLNLRKNGLDYEGV